MCLSILIIEFIKIHANIFTNESCKHVFFVVITANKKNKFGHSEHPYGDSIVAHSAHINALKLNYHFKES